MVFNYNPEVNLHQVNKVTSRDSISPFKKTISLTDAQASITHSDPMAPNVLNSPGMAEPLIDLMFFLYGNLYGRVKGDSCLFYPTCSHYSRLCFRDYNLFAGLWMTCGRLIRAHVNSDGFYPVVAVSEGIRYLDLPQHERLKFYRSFDHEDYHYVAMPAQ